MKRLFLSLCLVCSISSLAFAIPFNCGDVERGALDVRKQIDRDIRSGATPCRQRYEDKAVSIHIASDDCVKYPPFYDLTYVPSGEEQREARLIARIAADNTLQTVRELPNCTSSDLTYVDRIGKEYGVLKSWGS